MRNRAVSGILACFWAWMAITYHFVHFTSINPAAWAFGVLYMLCTAMLMWLGVIHGTLRCGFSRRPRVVVAGTFAFYGLLVYPLLGQWLGHVSPRLPTFGQPCPTTIFTIGILFLLAHPNPRWFLAVPILWSVVGGSAAFSLGVCRDLGLLAAGACAVVLLLVAQRASGARRGCVGQAQT
jgi:hypothetical protein